MKRILVTLALTGMAVLLTLPSRALARTSAATAPCAVLPAADSVSPDSLRSALSRQRAAFERQRPAFDSLRSALSQQRAAFERQRPAFDSLRAAPSQQRAAFERQRPAFDSLRSALSRQRAAFERQRPAFDSLRAALSQQRAAFERQRRQTSQRMGPVAADSATELPSQPGDTLTCIYYGERVVPRLPNPCKGRTLRKLARVVYPGTWTQPTAAGLRYPVTIMHIPDATSDALYARFLKLEARTPGLTVVRDFRAGPAEVAQQ